MLSKGKKKGVTLKGRGGRQNGVNNGLPMRNGGQHQQAPLRKLPNVSLWQCLEQCAMCTCMQSTTGGGWGGG